MNEIKVTATTTEAGTTYTLEAHVMPILFQEMLRSMSDEIFAGTFNALEDGRVHCICQLAAEKAIPLKQSLMAIAFYIKGQQN